MANLQGLSGSLQGLRNSLQGFGFLANGGIPRAIHVYEGEVFVAFTNFVNVYSTSGSLLRSFGSEGSGNGEFNGPFGIHVYDDEVYVSESPGKRVQVFSLSGTYTRKWSVVNKALGLFVDSTGVYTAQAGDGAGSAGTVGDISKTANDGTLVLDFGQPYIRDITSDGTYLYATKALLGTSKVYKYNTSGTEIANFSIGSNISGIDYLSSELYVCSNGQHRVTVCDTSGAVDRFWGSEGTGDGEFLSVTSISIYGGEVYVTDTERRDIQVFDTDGNFIRKWST
jgi:DNA-binding beta-propeller fold protein YncE